jgi:hypothetical protein
MLALNVNKGAGFKSRRAGFNLVRQLFSHKLQLSGCELSVAEAKNFGAPGLGDAGFDDAGFDDAGPSEG